MLYPVGIVRSDLVSRFEAVSPLEKCRVLIVDDFAGWRRYIHTVLQAYPGFLVVGEAGDGPDAIRKSQDLLPDLVLLDIGLPEINGLEVARRICRMLSIAKTPAVRASS